MFHIIPPNEFRSIPWKNGLGSTTELLINDGGCLEHFDWRLSMAKVIENGVFSNFSGYWRNLVLIEGEEITLEHDGINVDHLTKYLSVATFDGGSSTVATLASGPITDFNVITRKDKYQTQVDTYVKPIKQALKGSEHCFIYALEHDVRIMLASDKSSQLNEQTTLMVLPAKHLLHISQENTASLSVQGGNLIISYLNTP